MYSQYCLHVHALINLPCHLCLWNSFHCCSSCSNHRNHFLHDWERSIFVFDVWTTKLCWTVKTCISVYIFSVLFFRSRRSVPIFVPAPFLVTLATPGTHRMEEVLTINYYSQHCVHKNQICVFNVWMHVLQFSLHY